MLRLGSRNASARNRDRSRRLLLQSLESRHLLAVLGGYSIDGFVVDPDPQAGVVIGEEFDAVRFDDPFGNSAELGAINAKYNKVGVINLHTPTASSPTLGYTDVNPGNDLSGIWLDTNIVENEIWLYFAFERESSSTGQIGFEFQADAAPTIGNAPVLYNELVYIEPPGPDAYTQSVIDAWNPWGNRQAGDFSLVFDTQGRELRIVLREYDGKGFNSTTLNTDISGASFSADGLRGEGAVNLTAIMGTGCFSFSNILPFSVTGNSDKADFKDVLIADLTSVIPVQNCGFSISKDGDALSKVGDTVSYSITLENLGFAGSPPLSPYDAGGVSRIQDSLVGVLNPSDFTETGGIGTNGDGLLDEGEIWTLQYDLVVPVDASDPMINTVTATFDDSNGFEQTRTAVHSVNLFQPDVFIDLGGDDLSKIGDEIQYTILVTRGSSSADTPALVGSVTDPYDGSVTNIRLEHGETYVETGTYLVQPTDTDPFQRTAAVTVSPEGFPNVLSASDSHEVNLFQPAVSIDLQGDALSKIGDVINYTITVDNGSSADSPNLIGTVTDPYDGSVTPINLAAGQQYVANGTYTVQTTDTDPFTRTATVTVSPDGFPNVLTDAESHEVNLFQPSIKIDLSGDELSKVGDVIQYTIVVDNDSSADTPNLIGSVTDPYDGSVTSINLGVGQQYVEHGSYTVQSTDTDPFDRTASVTVSPEGFPNVLTKVDSHQVNLFQPAIAIDLSGDELSKVGDVIQYNIVVENQSSTDSPNLIGTVTDPYDGSITSINLAHGQIYTETGSYLVQSTDTDPFTRTAQVTVSPDGFPNILAASDDLTVNLFQPDIAIEMTGDTLSKIGDTIHYTITVDRGNSSVDTPILLGTLVDPFDGSVTSVSLDVGQTYTKNGTYVVQNTDTDPFTRTAEVTVSPKGFPNILNASDGHTVNLFQPEIVIELTGDELSKVGDEIQYTIRVDRGNSSVDTPSLIGTVTDPYDGSVTNIELADGQSYVETGSYVVQSTDTDPFSRTTSVTVSPDGFPNVLTDSDTHTVNLFQPAIELVKTGDASGSVGDQVDYDYTLSNAGSSDSPALVGIVITDDNGTPNDSSDDFSPTFVAGDTNNDGKLDLGETWAYSSTRTILLSDSNPLVNIAAVVSNPDGFPNVITDSDSHSVEVLQPNLVVNKTPDGQILHPGDTATFTIEVVNVGAGRAVDVSFRDPLPSPGDGLQPLTWDLVSVTGANPSDFSLVGNLLLTGSVASLEGDPTPGQINGDESRFTVVLQSVIPADYLDPSGQPGGPGTLGSTFDIDGDLTKVSGLAIQDWGSLPFAIDPDNPQPGELVNQPDLPPGQDDDSFGQGSKEDTEPPTVVAGSIPKNKSDLTNFLLSEEIVEGNVFLRLGFIRANTLGTANLDFELNKLTTLSANGVTPVRSLGDILITFDFASGGNVVELGLREWNGNAWTNPVDNSGTSFDLDAFAAAQGAVNDGMAVDNPLTADPNDTLASNTFGEAIVNLTKVFGGDCRSFATAYVKSRSSDSFTSSLKDFISPAEINIDTCQTIPLANTAYASAGNNAEVSGSGLIGVTNLPVGSGGLLSQARSRLAIAASDNPYDVDGNGYVSSLDALFLINYLGKADSEHGTDVVLPRSAALDVSGDGIVSPLDALMVINFVGKVQHKPLAAEAERTEMVDQALTELSLEPSLF